MSAGQPPVEHVMVCMTKCWPCQFGEHYDPPEAHTWLDQDDAQHYGYAWPLLDEIAEKKPCGCWCARPIEETDQLKAENTELKAKLGAVAHALKAKP